MEKYSYPQIVIAVAFGFKLLTACVVHTHWHHKVRILHTESIFSLLKIWSQLVPQCLLLFVFLLQMQEGVLKTLARLSMGTDWHRHRIIQVSKGYDLYVTYVYSNDVIQSEESYILWKSWNLTET